MTMIVTVQVTQVISMPEPCLSVAGRRPARGRREGCGAQDAMRSAATSLSACGAARTRQASASGPRADGSVLTDAALRILPHQQQESV
ncbi:hypothetical protein GCM10023167_15080 [Brevibacterium pityocampae]|uniref:Uncharacterized protein n=1 Tax=Brevibacterium pityocampae TaxID=506594 RepID=A0ABP8JE85_9MICO